VRRFAVGHLPNIADEWALNRLVAALDDGDAEVREAAVAALGSLGPLAVAPVSALLQREPKPEIRSAALQLLGELGGAPAAELMPFLADSDPGVRRAAAFALRGGGPTADDALHAAALDEDPEVRQGALDALGVYGNDPRRAIEEALSRGDETEQGVAARLVGSLTRHG